MMLNCTILIAKVRISKRKAKEKTFFLSLSRAKVLSAQPKGTNKLVKNVDAATQGAEF
jgi:hypothetical protein